MGPTTGRQPDPWHHRVRNVHAAIIVGGNAAAAGAWHACQMLRKAEDAAAWGALCNATAIRNSGGDNRAKAGVNFPGAQTAAYQAANAGSNPVERAHAVQRKACDPEPGKL